MTESSNVKALIFVVTITDVDYTLPKITPSLSIF